MRTVVAKGYSLVELSVVVAIIAVVSAIAAPRFAGSFQRYRASAAASRIVADLALAQAKAYSTSSTMTFAFSTSGNSYQILGMSDPDRPGSTYTVKLSSEPY